MLDQKMMYTAGAGLATYYAVRGSVSDQTAMAAAAVAAGYYYMKM